MIAPVALRMALFTFEDMPCFGSGFVKYLMSSFPAYSSHTALMTPVVELSDTTTSKSRKVWAVSRSKLSRKKPGPLPCISYVGIATLIFVILIAGAKGSP